MNRVYVQYENDIISFDNETAVIMVSLGTLCRKEMQIPPARVTIALIKFLFK